MAIAAVAATRIISSTGQTASASVSATAGNALFVGGGSFGGVAWTVTRTGDSYTTDTNGAFDSSNGWVGLASAPNVASGSVTLTVSASAGVFGISAYALECSGLPSSSIRDATSPAVATGSSTTAATNSLTNSTADAIYVAVNASDTGANPAAETPSGGWTDTVGGTTMHETDGTSVEVMGMAYQIVSTTASRSASWTVSNAGWGAVIGVYMAAGGAAGLPPGLGPVVAMAPDAQNLAASM